MKTFNVLYKIQNIIIFIRNMMYFKLTLINTKINPKPVWRFLRKLKQNYHMMQQSHSWASLQKKSIILKDTCIPVFIEALFTIARTWKQPKCSSTEKWIKMWHIYPMEYYCVIKNIEVMPFVATWMDLETIILSEVRQ